MQIEAPPRVRAAPKPSSARRGLVIVHTGDGKGKSTAAYGLALRAFGRRKSVKIFQFTKAASSRVGEHRLFAQLGIPIEVLGDGYEWDCRDAAHCVQLAGQSWARANAAIHGGKHFMVVLDDIMVALRHGWLKLDDLLQSLRTRPADVHVVLTGRNAPQDLIDLADTVTRMTLIKHHYMAGVAMQRGIED
jgi:cob(I)alamin adenosyltransferase